MFRLEVHLRITEDTGPHIQHMNTPASSAESFFLSSLFDKNQSVIVTGTNSLSKLSNELAGTSSPRTLLTSLVADELCCSIVDDFVTRATEGFPENSLAAGHHTTWKMGYPGEWNVFVGADGSSNQYNKPECASTMDSNFAWDKEQYNPYDLRSSDSIPNYFTRKVSVQQKPCYESLFKQDVCSLRDEQAQFQLDTRGHHSDSESSWSSSDGCSMDGDREESNRLWELFNNPSDPYHPLHFTACMVSSSPKGPGSGPSVKKSNTKVDSPIPSSSEDEEELLWRSLCQNDDPYHPLYFRACLRTFSTSEKNMSSQSLDCQAKLQAQVVCGNPEPPLLPKRQFKHHCHLGSDKRPVLVPWLKVSVTQHQQKSSSTFKQVRFSPLVQVHKMQTWSFALQASRKGPWEEFARDRDRFQRRIKETEQAIGYCLSHSHRMKILAYQ
ncbi:uncharacterized protein LOC114766756 isoform X2 [Denticeps clupeoides]|nr:uncharacterized protein LOC114766756 isoform X2 [Denticeps clupeoides]